MEGVDLFNGPMPVMSSADVAHLGYRGLKAGRRVVITGIVYKLLAFSTRFSPSSVLLPIASYLSKRGESAGH